MNSRIALASLSGLLRGNQQYKQQQEQDAWREQLFNTQEDWRNKQFDSLQEWRDKTFKAGREDRQREWDYKNTIDPEATAIKKLSVISAAFQLARNGVPPNVISKLFSGTRFSGDLTEENIAKFIKSSDEIESKKEQAKLRRMREMAQAQADRWLEYQRNKPDKSGQGKLTNLIGLQMSSLLKTVNGGHFDPNDPNSKATIASIEAALKYAENADGMTTEQKQFIGAQRQAFNALIQELADTVRPEPDTTTPTKELEWKKLSDETNIFQRR